MNRNECYKKAGLLAVLTLCLSLILFAAGAAAETEGDFTYTVSDGCATITNYDGFSTVTIPETLGGYPVTAIGSFAFSHDYITSVTMPDSVVSIGNYAFYNRTSLSSVSFGSGVVSIGDSAFNKCSALTEIVIPDSVTTLGTDAFYGCTKLASVTLGSGLAAIPGQTFYGCSALTSISIPAGVTSIGSWAFRNCTALKDVYTPSLAAWLSIEFEDYYATPMYYADNLYVGNALLTNAVIAEGTASINNWAFYNCASLTSVSIPASVTSIGIDAFYKCSALEKVHIPTLDAWLGIEFPVYSANPLSGTAGLYIAGMLLTDAVIPDGVTAINDYAFYGYDKLATLSIPESTVSIGKSAFYDCTSLRLISLHDNIETIGEAAFHYGSGMLYASIGTKTAKAISASGSVFVDPLYSSLSLKYDDTLGLCVTNFARDKTSVVVPEGVESISSSAFKSSSIVSITLPSTLTSIGESAFYDCYDVKEVHIPTLSAWLGITLEGYSSNPLCDSNAEDSTLYIGGSPLTHLVIPDGVTAIDAYRFYGCKTLVSIDFPDSVTSIGYEAFEYCSNLKSVTLPDSVHTVDSLAFNCGSSCEITLPDNITKIGTFSPFGYDGIVLVNPDSVTFATLCDLGNDFLYCDKTEGEWVYLRKEDGTLMLGGYRGKATSITLPAGATAIAANAFDHERNEKLRSIVIPEGYESIGNWAFDGCENLAHISLPSTLHVIGESAFWGIDLTTIQLPEGLTIIGENAFSACWDLESLTIPSTVTSIPDVIANELTTVVLPREIEYIAPGAFGESLSTVYCYRGTYAQEWAKDNAPLVRLIGEGTLEDLVELSMPRYYEDDPEYCVFEVGNTYPFMTGISTGTLPFDANYTFTCTSSNPAVAMVDGDVLTFLKPGKATITIGIAERPDVAKLTRTIEVFNPVTSFTVPDAVFVHIDAEDPAYITPENIEPAKDANPYFRRVDSDGWWSWKNIEDRGVRFWPEDRLGAMKCEIESFSGVSQPILFVTYDKIGEVYADAPDHALTVGEIYEPDVTVMVDGAELEKLSYLYTLKSSNAKVAAITEDEMIRAVAPGTATITVTARNSGKTAKFTVTVIHSVLLDLPSSLKRIEEEAFAGVSAGEIRIPDGCTSIGARAFAGCKNLYEVTIPASVTEIADDAFDGCSGVNIIAPEGSAGQQAASDNGFTFTAM